MCHPRRIYRFNFDISGEGQEERQKGICQECIKEVGEAGAVALKGAWEEINRSLPPSHPIPLLHFFLTVHDRIVQCQKCSLSFGEGSVFIS